MKAINELEKSLAVHLPWHKSRLNCFTRMILGMIAVRTVNLVDLACAFGGGKTKALSNYRRLQRFSVALRLLYSSGQLVVWVVCWQRDRIRGWITQWQWENAINILMLSLVHKGTAIPIYWTWWLIKILQIHNSESICWSIISPLWLWLYCRRAVWSWIRH